MTIHKDDFDRERLPVALMPEREKRVGLAQMAAVGIVAIFIVSVVLYGIENQRDESTQPAPAEQVTSQGGAQQTTQPAPANGQANSSQGQPRQGKQQAAAPSQNAAAPTGAGNPPTTTGQGN